MAADCLGIDTVVDFVESRVDPATRQRIEQHASRCEACRALLSSLAREAASTADLADSESAHHPELDAPTPQIGRYQLLRVLGRGGMGIVYAAYDPALDRTVAIKLLRGVATPEVQDRLRREAQVMAQVRHPNVIPVHDVGVVDEHIFVVMEHAEEGNLATWLATPRSTAEILDAYRAAGCGLAAVHAAGLVHRDFKPENVLRGADGHVRVADFGLAGPSTPSEAHPTHPGVIAGTPVYMAPEVHRGDVADARSDQFSFCVALFIALYGAQPFASESWPPRRDALEPLECHEPGDVPSGLSRRVRAAIRRGLSADAAARFPAMTDLLAALAPPPRRWPWLIAAGTSALVATALVVLASTSPVAPLLVPCRGVEADLDPVWSADRARQIDAGLTATGVPAAPATTRAVRSTLEAYAAEWRTMRVQACQATRITEIQTEPVLELRMACLDLRAQALDSTAALLAHADRAVASRALAVAQGLPAIADCADLATLASPVRPPTAALKATVARLRARVVALQAQRAAGRYRAAEDGAAAIAAAVDATSYRPLEGELYLLRAQTASDREDYRAARPAFERAILASEAGRDDRTTAEALTGLIHVVGTGLSDAAAVPPLRDRARAVLERLDHPVALDAALAQTLGGVAIDAADFPEAERELAAARELWERLVGTHDVRVVPTLYQLGMLELHRAHLPQARTYFEQARAIQERVLGDAHPDVADTLQCLGDVETADGRYAAADALYLRALAIDLAALGPDSPAVADLLVGRGNLAEWTGDQDTALALERRAIAIDLQTLGPDHRATLAHQLVLASALDSASRSAEARALLADVLPRVRTQLGPDHQLLAYGLETMANVDLGLHDFAAARDHAREAIGMYGRVLGSTYSPWEEQRTLGEALLGTGDAPGAVEVLEPARRAVPPDSDPGVIARLDGDLGRALVESGRDRARGFQLTAAAWRHIATDDRMTDERATLAAWRTAHPRAR